MTRYLKDACAALLLAWLAAVLAAMPRPAIAADGDGTRFRRIPTQYIAALGEPSATSGEGAERWGLWRVDPGPRGVPLGRFAALEEAGGVAPARWRFDGADWWLEENGRIMESPEFPLPAGKYLVTGNREVLTVLTVDPPDASGNRRWILDRGASLHDVTHLGCRSARYTPLPGEGSCSPANAPLRAFRVAPGAAMPAVAGCRKQDYAVLLVVGVAASD